MNLGRKTAIAPLIAISVCVFGASATLGQQVNESNLWFGDEPGIEIVFRTGENLAFTDDDPRVDGSHDAIRTRYGPGSAQDRRA